MKKFAYTGLAALVLSCLTFPLWAQRGGQGHAAKGMGEASMHAPSALHTSMATARSNKGGKVRGKARAEEVQSMNTKADSERGFTVAPGLTQTGASTKGQSSTRGQSAAHDQTGKQQSTSHDTDESKD